MKKILLLLVLLNVSSCASIVSDNEYLVDIESFPSDTQFMIKDENQNIVSSGRTPNKAMLEASDGFFSKAHYTVEFANNGQKVEKKINPELDNWYWGNILFGGPIGLLIVDPITGSMYELPEKVITDVTSIHKNQSTMSANQSQSMPINQNINLTVNVNGENGAKTEAKKTVTKTSQAQ